MVGKEEGIGRGGEEGEMEEEDWKGKIDGRKEGKGRGNRRREEYSIIYKI